MRRSLIGLIVFGLEMSSALAANHYVRQGAGGSGDGSDWTNAYARLPAALVRGDTYYIASGSYDAYTCSTRVSGTALIVIKKATTADHGTDSGWSSAYADGQAVFAGKIEFTSSYWLFDGQTGGGPQNHWNQGLGFKIVETNDANALVRVGYSGAAANNVTVRHVELQGKGGGTTQGGYYSNDGVALYNGAANFTLSHAWLHGVGRCPLFIISALGQTIMEYVYVESFFGTSEAHSEVMSAAQGPVGDVTWRYSLITDSQSTGGLMWDNQDSPEAHLYVYGNTFYQRPGVRWSHANGVIGGWTSNSICTNIWLYNNTFIDIDYLPLSTFPNTYSGNVAFNNIFYNTASPDFGIFGTHDYNLFINSGGSHGEAHGATGSADPFLDVAGLDFQLTTSTQGGKALPAPFDLDPRENRRGADGTWDQGAFEYEAGRRAPSPPTHLRIR